jgi:uncharacterized protein (TIGR03435 family)
VYGYVEGETLRLTICSFLLLGAIPTWLAGQSAQPLTFEVASIKPAEAGARPLGRIAGGPGTDSPGQLTLKNYQVDSMVREAYDKQQRWEVVFPRSLPAGRYDIVAKVPPGTSREQMYLMLQNLLAERFGLVVHKETREMPVYDLLAKESPQFTAVDPPQIPQLRGLPTRTPLVLSELPKDKEGWPILPPGSMGVYSESVGDSHRTMFRTQPVSTMIGSLQAGLGRPIVDKTGLTGVYNFDLTYPMPGRLPDAVRSLPAESSERRQAVIDMDNEFLSNLHSGVERLGLKLVSAKGQIEVLVVDKVNSTPTDN